MTEDALHRTRSFIANFRRRGGGGGGGLLFPQKKKRSFSEEKRAYAADFCIAAIN